MNTNLIKNNTENKSKLNYSILVEEKEGGYQATVCGLHDFQVFAPTREDALQNLHNLVNNRLQSIEILTQEIEVLKYDHPWMKFAGKYKDDHQFDDMLAFIEDYRQELDRKSQKYNSQFDGEEEVK
jgi:predicted RNase H-like HicB family nuclease